MTAALKRRNLYPIVEIMERGKKVRAREVMFRGGVDDAIEFLGSERMGAVNLAVRALTRQKDAAREKLAAAIQQEMFRQAAPAWGEFRKLRNLIRLLGRLGGGSSEGPLARLLEKELDYVASQPARPSAPKRPSEVRYRNEADDDSANHALAWLAVAIDEQVLLQQYGNRLMKIRDATQGHWKAELQLAMDAAHVEDNLELISLPEGNLCIPRLGSITQAVSKASPFLPMASFWRPAANGVMSASGIRAIGRALAVSNWRDKSANSLFRRMASSFPPFQRTAPIWPAIASIGVPASLWLNPKGRRPKIRGICESGVAADVRWKVPCVGR